MTTEDEEHAKQVAEAEARRQRILAKAEDRLKAVDGSGGAVPAQGDTKPSSKLQAMRRRRFKGKKAATETSPEKEASKDAAAEPEATPATPEPEEPTGVEEPTAATETAEEETKPAEVEQKPKEEVKPAETEKKPKYKGVAAMQRKKLKAKLDAKEEASATIVAKPRKKRTALDRLPIIMHAVTVLLLFLAGFEIGLQQQHDYGDSLDIQKELVPSQNGLAISDRVQSAKDRITSTVEKLSNKVQGIGEKITSKITVEEEAVTTEKEHVDEFADAVVDDDAGLDAEENIDPLFGVDLDKLTKGPGPLMFMGRFAVRVHRVNLSVFYYLPRRITNAMWNVFKGLVDQPPIMCLSALVIRQLIGKGVLGASLPAPVEDAKEHKDVMSMVKNMVTGLFIKGFPNAVTIYDVWTHVRSDMYVVLCGLFVALAWQHTDMAQGELIETEVPRSSSEEL